MSELDRRINAVARSHAGVIALSQLGDDPATRAAVHRRVVNGSLERLAPRTYASAAVAPSPEQHLLGLVASIPSVAVLSHLAAGRRYGLNGYSTAPPELSVPRGSRVRGRGVRIHESTDLDRCTIVDLDGVPTTDPGRTLLDIARYVGLQRLARNVENARRLGLLDWPDLITTLAAHARRGRPGIRKLRAVIDHEMQRRTITDSDLELLVFSLLRSAGLPEPVIHHRVFEGERFVAEVDLAYPASRIAIECDGDVHLEAGVRQRDLRRQNDLVLSGWLVLRFTADDYRRRAPYIVSEVRAACRRRLSPLD